LLFARDRVEAAGPRHAPSLRVLGCQLPVALPFRSVLDPDRCSHKPKCLSNLVL
jgi:hypothetical protein